VTKSVVWRGSLALVSMVLALGVAACGAGKAGGGKREVSAPALAARAPGDELYELSPARIQIRRLGPQSLRLLAPHWSSIREADRRVLQATLLSTLSEDRIAPFVRARLKQAVAERPDLAAATIEWLHGPVGYEVKFAEATAWSGDKASDGAFYASVAEVRDNRTPEIRAGRIHRLAEETDALGNTLDLTASVGTVVARLVNVARANEKPLRLDDLKAAIARERMRPEVADAYRPVVTAALLVRCRDLDLAQLDGYIAFAATEAGRWYHDTVATALTSAVADASLDVEGVLDTNRAASAPAAMGVADLDSLLVTLPSGRQVRFLTFAQGGAPSAPSIVLRYETSLPLADTAAITREAGEVWDKVRMQVESEGARAAMLQATGSVEGWVFPFALSRKFAWTRDEGGQWIATDGGKPTATSTQREMLWSVPP
jgi:hypothetical protein